MRGIVEQQRGRIWFYSEPGKGTSFKIFFPRHAAAEEREADAAAEDPLPRGSGELILLVDDTDLVRDVIAEMLEMHGYRVLICASPEESQFRWETCCAPFTRNWRHFHFRPDPRRLSHHGRPEHAALPHLGRVRGERELAHRGVHA